MEETNIQTQKHLSSLKKMNYWLMFKYYNLFSLCFLLPIFKVDDCPNNTFKILILQETSWKLYGLPFIWIGAWVGISAHLVYTLIVASTSPLIWKWIHAEYFYFEAIALSITSYYNLFLSNITLRFIHVATKLDETSTFSIIFLMLSLCTHMASLIPVNIFTTQTCCHILLKVIRGLHWNWVCV